MKNMRECWPPTILLYAWKEVGKKFPNHHQPWPYRPLLTGLPFNMLHMGPFARQANSGLFFLPFAAYRDLSSGTLCTFSPSQHPCVPSLPVSWAGVLKVSRCLRWKLNCVKSSVFSRLPVSTSTVHTPLHRDQPDVMTSIRGLWEMKFRLVL